MSRAPRAANVISDALANHLEPQISRLLVADVVPVPIAAGISSETSAIGRRLPLSVPTHRDTRAPVSGVRLERQQSEYEPCLRRACHRARYRTGANAVLAILAETAPGGSARWPPAPCPFALRDGLPVGRLGRRGMVMPVELKGICHAAASAATTGSDERPPLAELKPCRTTKQPLTIKKPARQAALWSNITNSHRIGAAQ